MTKHFFKAFGLFAVMIILALIGIVVVSHFEKSGTQVPNTNNGVQVAK